MAEEELFFINLEGADELRKELLESSKGVVEILKNYEKFKEINDERHIKTNELKQKIKEVSSLVAQIRDDLPAPKIKEPKKIKIKKVQKVVKKETTELDRLKEELNEIEAKLNSI